MSASADSFVSEASNIFKTRIEGANNAATGLIGLLPLYGSTWMRHFSVVFVVVIVVFWSGNLTSHNPFWHLAYFFLYI